MFGFWKVLYKKWFSHICFQDIKIKSNIIKINKKYLYILKLFSIYIKEKKISEISLKEHVK